MEIKQTAVAGTLESSDIQIMLSQGSDGIKIDLESDVEEQFGSEIRKVIESVLKAFDIDNVTVKAIDKGALDCVIKARTITVAQRALEMTEEPAWEVL